MTQQANCKITARLDNGDLFEENVSVIWINDKSMTVKVKSGAYHRFPIERVMRLEWISLARVVQRWSDRRQPIQTLGDLIHRKALQALDQPNKTDN